MGKRGRRHLWGDPPLPFDDGHEALHPGERLLSVQEVADYLEVPVKAIYTWRHRNTGPKGFRVGKHPRFRWGDVEAWLTGLIADQAERAVAHIRRHSVDPSQWQVRYIDPAGRERSKTFRRKIGC